MKKNVYIHTFGCQMNIHDSEKMLGILEQEGFTETGDPNDAELIIFNTCSIRQKAEQKFYSELGRIKAVKKKRPRVQIAVAGCIAQQEGENIMSCRDRGVRCKNRGFTYLFCGLVKTHAFFYPFPNPF